MGKPTLTLRCGARTLNLNDQSYYYLTQDFVPPATSFTPQFATGSSANVYGGGTLVAERANNQSFSFTVTLKSTSGASITQLSRSIMVMLRLAGGSTPLYLDYQANSDLVTPLWGQTGAPVSYEVAYGTLDLGDGYLVGVRRFEDVNAIIALTIKPFAHGLQQRVCAATGGIAENTIGTVDGRSRGVVIPEATTNMITNPIFGNATYSTDWTTGANLFSPKNTDKQYILFGEASVKLTGNAATATLYSQTITFAINTYMLSCYAKLEDSSAVTTTQILMWYDTGAVTPTYTSVGNGWYRAVGTFTGAVGSKVVGVTIENNSTVYVDGFQLEAKDHVTPLAYGDMLGCAWAGTVHASTTSRTAASCKLYVGDDTIMPENGAIRVVWIPNRASTGAWLSNVATLFDTRNGASAALSAYYNATDDKFYFSDGANTIATAAQTFAAGDVLILHFTWNKGGLNIYKNGANASPGNAFTMYAFGNYIFIGTSNAPDKPCDGTLNLATFGSELTSTQVTNDYNNLAPLVAAGQRVDAVPWLWTLNGDNILSLDTGKQPLGVVSGVPGSMPAITEIQGTLSSNWSTIKSIALSAYPCDVYLGLGPFLYDYSGTAGGGDYGAAHLTTTVNTTGVVLSPANPILGAFIVEQINGIEYYVLARLFGSAATAFNIYSAWSNSSMAISSNNRAITPAAGTAYRMFRTAPNKVSFDTKNFTGIVGTQITNYIYGSKIVSNVDISVDYIVILPRPCAFITGGNMATTTFILKGFSAYQTTSGFNSFPLYITGDSLEFAPNKLNHVQCYFCVDETVDPVTTYTTTLSAIYVTPRWALL